MIALLLTGCSSRTAAPAELADDACAAARAVPMVGSAGGGDAYQFSRADLADWVETLADAAEAADSAAAADAAYDDLSEAAQVASDDLGTVRDAVADDRAIGGEELTAIQEHLASLAQECDALAE